MAYLWVWEVGGPVGVNCYRGGGCTDWVLWETNSQGKDHFNIGDSEMMKRAGIVFIYTQWNTNCTTRHYGASWSAYQQASLYGARNKDIFLLLLLGCRIRDGFLGNLWLANCNTVHVQISKFTYFSFLSYLSRHITAEDIDDNDGMQKYLFNMLYFKMNYQWNSTHSAIDIRLQKKNKHLPLGRNKSGQKKSVSQHTRLAIMIITQHINVLLSQH